MDADMQFGELVKSLRESKAKVDSSFRLRKFAKRVGVSHSYLSSMEQGRLAPPSAKVIILIAGLLDYDKDALLALGHKVDPELEIIIRENPRYVPDLIRTVRGMAGEQVKAVTDFAEYQKGKGKE